MEIAEIQITAPEKRNVRQRKMFFFAFNKQQNDNNFYDL